MSLLYVLFLKHAEDFEANVAAHVKRYSINFKRQTCRVTQTVNAHLFCVPQDLQVSPRAPLNRSLLGTREDKVLVASEAVFYSLIESISNLRYSFFRIKFLSHIPCIYI